MLTVGLIGYSLWCLVQAIMDTENKGNTIFGIITRLFYAGVGIVYAGIAWSAVQLLMQIGAVREGDKPEQEWTARFLRLLPYGRWIVAIVGAGFIGFCFYELRRAFGNKLRILKTERQNPTEDLLATRIAQIGITARAAVFALIGFFLSRAGIYVDPKRVRGISGVLGTLVQEPYGPWLLTIVAVGLISYGIYMLFLSWRRRIDLAANNQSRG